VEGVKMGVQNTRYNRVTLYLKRAHLSFLDSIINEISEENPDSNRLSRSDLIRAILDKQCGTEDWQTDFIYNNIEKKNKQCQK
jgi:hypothetical protein